MLLGQIEDNFGLLYFLRFVKQYGYDFINIVSKPFPIQFNITQSSEPLFLRFIFWLGHFLDSFLLYNSLVVVLFVLNAIFAYKLFSLFLSHKGIKVYLSAIFAFSPYFLYQYRSHIQLMFVFLVINVFILVLTQRKNNLLIPLHILVLTLISNYLAFFTLVLYSIYIFCFAIISYLVDKKVTQEVKKVIFTYIKNIAVYLLTLIVLVTIFELSHFNNFIIRETNSFQDTQQLNAAIPTRPYEDFFHFTSRPWYFVLSSPENPLLGSFTRATINKLQSTNYFLFNNYFPSEHSASYLGIVNMFLAIFGIYVVVTKSKDNEQSKILYSLLLVFVFISLIMMPPYFTLAGFKIYMPSYLFSKFFNMFRVLSRLGVINLLIVLVFTGIGYNYLLERFRASNRFFITKFLFFVLFLTSFIEFWVPVVITKAGSPPAVYSYLGTLSDKGSIIVYPFEHANSTLVWHSSHNMPAFNSKYSTTNFDPRTFTKDLFTAGQLSWAKNNGAKYVIIFGSSGLSKADSHPSLNKIRSFPRDETKKDYGNALYRVINVGPHEKATLYKIN